MSAGLTALTVVLIGQLAGAPAQPTLTVGQPRDAELKALVADSEALYGRSDYLQAAVLSRKAIAIADDIGDQFMRGEARNTLGLCLWRTGEVVDALDLLQQAIDIWKGFRNNQAAAFSNRALVLQEAGRFDEARQSLASALAIVQGTDARGEGFTRHNLAAVLAHLGQREEGLQEIRRAARLLRSVGDRLAEGRALLVQSQIELELNRRAGALQHAQTALELVKSNTAAHADALRMLGRITAATPATAIAYLEQARALYHQVGSRRGEADVLHALGVLALHAGDPAHAITELTRARDLRRAIGVKRLEADSLVRMADAERALGNLDRAHDRIEDALVLVEELRAGLFDREIRASYLDVNHDYYARNVDLLVELHRQRPTAGFGALAFEAAESHRARQLVEELRVRWSGAVPAGQAELAKEETDLRSRLNYLSWQSWQLAARPESAAREQTVRKQIDALLSDYRGLEGRIARAMPEYSALVRPERVPLAAAQRELGDSLLIHYTLGNERSYVMVVSSTTIEIVDLPKRDVIEPRARAFHRMLASRETDAAVRARRERETRSLGRLLLQPIAGLLGRRPLTIIADGATQFIPFGALIVDEAPLVAAHAIATAPSTATLMMLRAQTASRPVPPKVVAVFADPVFDARDVRVRAPNAQPADTSATSLTRRLSRLPFSRDEADHIAAVAGAAVTRKALDFDATRLLAMSPEMRDYRVLHFATHGIQQSDHPELSGIVLSMVDAKGAQQDGFLRLHDIYTLRLNSDLVVLSACDTALPAGRHALANLASGFFAAGVPRVIASLWKVSDDAAAAVTSAFYRSYLRDGRDAATALAEAQRAVAKEYRFRDPAHWAAFVLQGLR